MRRLHHVCACHDEEKLQPNCDILSAKCESDCLACYMSRQKQVRDQLLIELCSWLPRTEMEPSEMSYKDRSIKSSEMEITNPFLPDGYDTQEYKDKMKKLELRIEYLKNKIKYIIFDISLQHEPQGDKSRKFHKQVYMNLWIEIAEVAAHYPRYGFGFLDECSISDMYEDVKMDLYSLEKLKRHHWMLLHLATVNSWYGSKPPTSQLDEYRKNITNYDLDYYSNPQLEVNKKAFQVLWSKLEKHLIVLNKNQLLLALDRFMRFDDSYKYGGREVARRTMRYYLDQVRISSANNRTSIYK